MSCLLGIYVIVGEQKTSSYSVVKVQTKPWKLCRCNQKHYYNNQYFGSQIACDVSYISTLKILTNYTTRFPGYVSMTSTKDNSSHMDGTWSMKQQIQCLSRISNSCNALITDLRSAILTSSITKLSFVDPRMFWVLDLGAPMQSGIQHEPSFQQPFLQIMDEQLYI